MMDDEIKNLMAKLRKQNNNSTTSSSVPRFTNSLTNASNTIIPSKHSIANNSQAPQLHSKKQKTQKELDSDEELEREISEFNESAMDRKPVMRSLNTRTPIIQLNNSKPKITESRPIIPSKTNKSNTADDFDLDEDLESLMDDISESSKKINSDDTIKKLNAFANTDKAISKPDFLNQTISLSQQNSKSQNNIDPIDDLDKDLFDLDAELELDFDTPISAPAPKITTVQTKTIPANQTIKKSETKQEVNKQKPQKTTLSDDEDEDEDEDEDALYRELMELDGIEDEKSSKMPKSNSAATNLGNNNLKASKSVEKEEFKSPINTNIVNSNASTLSNQPQKPGFKFSNSSQSTTSNNSNVSKTSSVKPYQDRNTSKSPISLESSQTNENSQASNTSNSKKFTNRSSILESEKDNIHKKACPKTSSSENPQSLSNSSTVPKRVNTASNLNNGFMNKNFLSSKPYDNSAKIPSNLSPTQSKKVGFTPLANPLSKQFFEEEPIQPLPNIGPPGPAGFYAQFGHKLRYTDLTHTQVDKRPGEGEESGGFVKRMENMELERAKMEEWHLLKKSGWPNFLHHYEQNEYKELGINIQANSIDKIYSGDYKELRVPYLALVIKTIEYSDSDGGFSFFDSKNRIEASVSQSLIEEYEHYCKPGMVWVLESPTLYKPKKGDYHLVIHHSNLVQVFLAGRKPDGTRQEPMNIRDFKPLNNEDQSNTQTQLTSLYDISETDLISVNGTGEGQQTDKWDEYLDDDFDDFDDLF